MPAQENEMGTKSVGRLLASYTLPAIAGMVIVALNQIISSIFIGYGVGHLALAAMAVTFPVINLLMAFCQLIAVGCAAICSIELGRRNSDGAESMLGHSVLLELLAGTAFGLVFYIFLDPLLLFFGASRDTLAFAREFMLPLIIGSPLGFLMLGFNFLVRATGYPKTSMVTALVTSAGIIVFSPLFINAWGWGMFGAGLAQVVGQGMSVVWLALHFCRKTSLVHFRRGIWRLRAASVRKIIAIGMAPFLINSCACVVVVIINRKLLEYGGDLAVGAYGIVMRLVMLFGMCVVGLGQGMQPIVGFNYGARKRDRVRLALKYAVAAGTAVTLAGQLSGLLAPELLVRLFTDHAPLVEASAHAMRLCTLLFILVGPQIIIGIYFQSIGQSKIASIISMGRQMLFLVPSLFILPVFLGLDGVWLSMPCADVIGAALSFVFLWLAIRAEDNPCDNPGDGECKPPSDLFKPREL